jgi:hypothetical protein
LPFCLTKNVVGEHIQLTDLSSGLPTTNLSVAERFVVF